MEQLYFCDTIPQTTYAEDVLEQYRRLYEATCRAYGMDISHETYTRFLEAVMVDLYMSDNKLYDVNAVKQLIDCLSLYEQIDS